MDYIGQRCILPVFSVYGLGTAPRIRDKEPDYEYIPTLPFPASPFRFFALHTKNRKDGLKMKKTYFRGFYPQALSLRGLPVFVLHETSEVITDDLFLGLAEVNLRDYFPQTFKRNKPVLVQREIALELSAGHTTLNIRQLCQAVSSFPRTPCISRRPAGSAGFHTTSVYTVRRMRRRAPVPQDARSTMR